jgi:hypothetical protein
VLLNQHQRSFVRYAVELPCTFTYRGEVQHGVICNVGRLGGLLRTDLLVPMGTLLALSIARKGRAALSIERATVVHLAIDKSSNTAGVYLGLDFSKCPASEEAAWLSYIIALAGR